MTLKYGIQKYEYNKNGQFQFSPKSFTVEKLTFAPPLPGWHRRRT